MSSTTKQPPQSQKKGLFGKVIKKLTAVNSGRDNNEVTVHENMVASVSRAEDVIIDSSSGEEEDIEKVTTSVSSPSSSKVGQKLKKLSKKDSPSTTGNHSTGNNKVHQIKVVVIGEEEYSGMDQVFDALAPGKCEIQTQGPFHFYKTPVQFLDGHQAEICIWDGSHLLQNSQQSTSSLSAQSNNNAHILLQDVDLFLLCFNIVNEETIQMFTQDFRYRLAIGAPLAHCVLVGSLFLGNSANGTDPSSSIIPYVSRKSALEYCKLFGCYSYVECIPQTGVGMRDIINEAIKIKVLTTPLNDCMHSASICHMFDSMLRELNIIVATPDTQFVTDYSLQRLQQLITQVNEMDKCLQILSSHHLEQLSLLIKQQQHQQQQQQLLHIQQQEKEESSGSGGGGDDEPSATIDKELQIMIPQLHEIQNLLKQLKTKTQTFKLVLEGKIPLYQTR